MRNILDKSCRENQNTPFIFSYLFRKSCCLWDNVEKYVRARGARNYVTIWSIRVLMMDNQGYTHARALTRPHPRTHALTHTQKYAIRIAFPRQQWLADPHECHVIRALLSFSLIFLQWFRMFQNKVLRREFKDRCYDKMVDLLWNIRGNWDSVLWGLWG